AGERVAQTDAEGDDTGGPQGRLLEAAAVAEGVGRHRGHLARGDHQRDEVATPALPSAVVVVADRLLEEGLVVVEDLGGELGLLFGSLLALRLGRHVASVWWIVPRG